MENLRPREILPQEWRRYRDNATFSVRKTTDWDIRLFLAEELGEGYKLNSGLVDELLDAGAGEEE
jgi:hypothetical protein